MLYGSRYFMRFICIITDQMKPVKIFMLLIMVNGTGMKTKDSIADSIHMMRLTICQWLKMYIHLPDGQVMAGRWKMVHILKAVLTENLI